jgi:rhodanese-related sulfurtransferase
MGIELDEEVIVYCRSGRRSAQAKTLLKAAGFKLVFDGGAMSKLEEALEEPNSGR